MKFGGSLLDAGSMCASVDAFRRWRNTQPEEQRVLLVVGGGGAADIVRDFNTAFDLGDERSHWLAIRAMQLNAHCLHAAMPGSTLVTGPECLINADTLAILDPLAWLEREARLGVHIPHRWSFTSDSVAAHIAARIASSRLVMLKSTLPPFAATFLQLAAAGVVDGDFAAVASGLPRVEIVNLRSPNFESRVITQDQRGVAAT